MEKTYGIFDSRYKTNPNVAVCFEFCDTLNEAIENAPEYGDNNVIVEYARKKRADY